METLNFELTIDEANTILTALQELPAKICNPLSQKLRDQAQKQLAQNETEQAAE